MGRKGSVAQLEQPLSILPKGPRLSRCLAGLSEGGPQFAMAEAEIDLRRRMHLHMCDATAGGVVPAIQAIKSRSDPCFRI